MKHIQIPYFTGRIGIDAKFSSRTISLHYEDIVELIHEKIYRYNERFGNSPTYLLLSREAYESLFIQARRRNDFIPSDNAISRIFDETVSAEETNSLRTMWNNIWRGLA